MSDEEDNIFADSDDDCNDSDDTAELFAQSSSPSKKKKPPPPKKKKDEGDDLFDSDSDDDDDIAENKPAAKKQKPMSKREKLEALAKKKRADESPAPEPRKKRPERDGGGEGEPKKNDGYESEDSVDSAQIQRTEEDDNFIDTTGEDEDAVKELYAAQHFDEEQEDMEDNETGKKKRKYGTSRGDYEATEDGKEPDNPLDAAMMRLKRKKREKKSTLEMEDDIKNFLEKMDAAAESDEQAIAIRRPGLQKLAMLNEVLDMIKNQEYQAYLIEGDLLSSVRRWIQPLPNGQLGNVTVRQKLLDAIAKMGHIHPNALKRSELGKTVMLLHKHPKETPAMKRQTRELIEQWSRGIFQKSGNLRELEQSGRGEGTFAAMRRQQGAAATADSSGSRREKTSDLKSLIASGKRGGDAMSASVNRVRVPFSKGFAYSVRPTNKGVDVDPKRSPPKESRSGLTKRMIDKARKVGKNQRSANISIEGRPTKG